MGPEDFPGEAPVLWLVARDGPPWITRLAAALDTEGRRWAPRFRRVPIPPPAEHSPWAYRQAWDPPLRWPGPGGEDVARLGDAMGAPSSLAGIIGCSICAGQPDRVVRELLSQAADLLPTDGRIVLLEPNGRYLPAVARSLLASDDERGEGRRTLRAAEELRRLLEVCGFGIERALGIPGAARRSRLLKNLLRSDGGFECMVLLARRV